MGDLVDTAAAAVGSAAERARKRCTMRSRSSALRVVLRRITRDPPLKVRPRSLEGRSVPSFSPEAVSQRVPRPCGFRLGVRTIPVGKALARPVETSAVHAWGARRSMFEVVLEATRTSSRLRCAELVICPEGVS